MKMSLRTTFAVLAHLAALGTVGPALLFSLLGLAGLSLGLLPVFGIGLLLAALLALALFALAWEERNRVAALFGVPVPARRMRVSGRNDGLRLPHTLLLQFADGSNWLGLLHAVVMSVLGTAVLGALQMIVWSLVLPFTPLLPAGPPGSRLELFGLVPAPTEPLALTALGLGGLLLGAVLLYLAATAHRAVSLSFYAPDRERQLEEQARRSAQRRSEAVRAAQVERSRIERDLHDGVQPRLVSVGMTLGMAKRKIDEDPARARTLLDEAHASTKEAIAELRRLARGFHPAVLEDQGLDAALSALAAASHVPVELEVDMTGRSAGPAEAAVYFAIAESLTNVAKHSGARAVRVTVRQRPNGMLWARIEDDGEGGARIVPGGGIDGVVNRVRAAGGECSLSSPLGGPTTIEVSVPCAS
ncbi:MAG: histidine kinase [Pseudoclavibacter sp.]|nr:histidine kinase [Pseudoclavibacter sp.]